MLCPPLNVNATDGAVHANLRAKHASSASPVFSFNQSGNKDEAGEAFLN
jgi:hypothetical protein